MLPSPLRPSLALAILLSLPAASQAAELTLPEDREYLSVAREQHIANAPIEETGDRRQEIGDRGQGTEFLPLPYRRPQRASP